MRRLTVLAVTICVRIGLFSAIAMWLLARFAEVTFRMPHAEFAVSSSYVSLSGFSNARHDWEASFEPWTEASLQDAEIAFKLPAQLPWVPDAVFNWRYAGVNYHHFMPPFSGVFGIQVHYAVLICLAVIANGAHWLWKRRTMTDD